MVTDLKNIQQRQKNVARLIENTPLSSAYEYMQEAIRNDMKPSYVLLRAF
jgi:hypothetical protein